MELGIDDLPGEDDKKYKDGMQVGKVAYLGHFFFNPILSTHPSHSIL